MKPLKEQIEELRGHGYSAVLASGQKGVKWGMSMGLVKTRRLAAMQKQQRAKAGMRPLPAKCGARKGDDAFWSRDGYKAKRKDSR